MLSAKSTNVISSQLCCKAYVAMLLGLIVSNVHDALGPVQA